MRSELSPRLEKRQYQDGQDLMIRQDFMKPTLPIVRSGHRSVVKKALQHTEVLAHIQRFRVNSTSVISTEVEISHSNT